MAEKTQQGTAITNKEDNPGKLERAGIVGCGGLEEKTTSLSLERVKVDLLQQMKRSRMTTEAMTVSHM